jgi:isoaspartyl peptidase/L-asparaginase-like protein (Ntn-hydrolase superfamily)
MPVFERGKTFHASDRAVTVIGCVGLKNPAKTCRAIILMKSDKVLLVQQKSSIAARRGYTVRRKHR